MALSDLLPRETVIPGMQAPKLAELTFAEGDNNLKEIFDYLTALSSGGSGIAVYSPSTTYTNTTFVAYGGNIWKHVTTSSIGITPGTNSSIWELSSIGALAHERNKDQYLDFGGATEVSSADLFDLLNNQVINTGLSGFATLFNADSIKKNRWYSISDYDYFGVDHTLYLQGINSGSDTVVSPSGYLRAVLPLISIALWQSGGTYAIADRVSWGNKVYRNVTGSNPDSPEEDAVNWTEELSSSYYRYALYATHVHISQSGTPTIKEVRDCAGNIFSKNSYLTVCHQNVEGIKADTDTTISLPNVSGSIENINAQKSIIAGTGDISGSIDGINSEGGELYLGNNFAGSFFFWNVKNAIIAFADDFADTLNNVRVEDINFSINTGEMSSDIVVNRFGSTQERTITSLSLGGNYGHVGVFNLNATGSYSALTGSFSHVFPFIIKPTNGNTVTLNLTSIGSATSGQIVGNGSSVVLEGSKGEYAKLQYRVINGVDVFHVIENNQIS